MNLDAFTRFDLVSVSCLFSLNLTWLGFYLLTYRAQPEEFDQLTLCVVKVSCHLILYQFGADKCKRGSKKENSRGIIHPEHQH